MDVVAHFAPHLHVDGNRNRPGISTSLACMDGVEPPLPLSILPQVAEGCNALSDRVDGASSCQFSGLYRMCSLVYA